MSGRPPFDGKAILQALIDAEVDFIVVGGFAVIAHGYSRTTDDFDIVPAPDPENLTKLAALLEQLNYRIAGTEEFASDELVHPDLEGLLAGGSWVLNTKYGGLDILQLVEPDLDYEALANEAITATVLGHPIRFCGYRHLVAMKEAAGRPRDLDDLQRLRQIKDPDA